jgi:hypothetical protein
LINAPHDKEFHFHDGTRAKNLLELVSKIETLADHDFHHFVNAHKNDFSNWIEHVLFDEAFAQKLREVHSKDETVQLIKDKIADYTIGNSILKIPKIEDHSPEHPGHVLVHEIPIEHKEEHQKIHEEIIQAVKTESNEHEIAKEADSHERHIHEPHVLDQIPPLVIRDRHHDRLEESRSKRGWFRFMSKKKITSKDLERIGNEESDKLRAESELGEEIYNDEKENALWTVLYIVLVILIITLLAYKLFL